MDAIEDIAGAKRALRRFLAQAEAGDLLPADTLDRLGALADSPSPVDTICRSAELMYARRGELDEDGRAVAAGLAAFAAVNGWHGLAEGNRGGLIAQALGREAREGDPAPVSALVAAEPAAAA